MIHALTLGFVVVAASPLEEASTRLSEGAPLEEVYDALQRPLGKKGPDAATAEVLAGMAAELERWAEAEKWLASAKATAAQRAWVQRMAQLAAGPKPVYDAVRYDALQAAAAEAAASGQLLEATRLTGRAEAAGPSRHEHAAVLGLVLLEARQPREAYPWLEAAAARAPAERKEALEQARAQCEQTVRWLDARKAAGSEGDLSARAKSAYDAYRLRPDRPDGLLEGALLFWQSGDPARALELLGVVERRGAPNEARSAGALRRAIEVDGRLREKMNAGAAAAPPPPAFGPTFDEAMAPTFKQIADSKAYAAQAAQNSIAYQQKLQQKLKDLDAEISTVHRQIWAAEDRVNSSGDLLDELTTERARETAQRNLNEARRELRQLNTKWNSLVRDRGYTRDELNAMLSQQ